MITIRVPASTSNLGAGFDTFGLALELYLDVAVEGCEDAERDGAILSAEGEGAGELPSTPDNLVNVAYRLAGVREGIEPPPAVFRVRNEIPVARGLGSSAAAAVAGFVAFEVMTGVAIPEERLLSYGVEIEGHADNVAASALGGFVTCCTVDRDVPAVVRREWPEEIRAVVVVPEVPLSTEEARRILPRDVPRRDAIFDVQRAALFGAAIDARRWDLLGEAMRDRLHQPYREALLPGLAAALALEPSGAMLGVAMSGAGSAVLALATGDYEATGDRIARCFAAHGVATRVLVLGADHLGRRVLT